jgi:hypothetical protein
MSKYTGIMYVCMYVCMYACMYEFYATNMNSKFIMKFFLSFFGPITQMLLKYYTSTTMTKIYSIILWKPVTIR